MTHEQPISSASIAIVGITGQVGSRLASSLNAEAEVRGVARHPHDYGGSGRVRLTPADMRDPREARRALAGVTAVYLTPPLGERHPLEDQRGVVTNVIEAARHEDVQHLVMHTALHAKQADTGARVIDEKKPLEETLKASGVPFTILRPGWFLDNLLSEREALASGTLLLPIPPERRLGVVAARDVANAAAGFLKLGPQNRGFDLHVPGGVDGAELAQAATRALGQPVTYQEAGLDQFVENTSGGAAQHALQRELYAYLREHDFVGRPDDIRQVLPGFRYTSVEQFMERRLAPETAAAAIAAAPTASPWLPMPPSARPLRPEAFPYGRPEPPGPRFSE